MNNNKIFAWWSGGITSAVACRICLDTYQNVELLYIETGSHHPDTMRFKAECEQWYNSPIRTLQNTKFDNHFDVLLYHSYVNGTAGVKCSKELKKVVREKLERTELFEHQIFGFEFEIKQINRAIRWQEQYAYTLPKFPLIEHKLSKNECAGIVTAANIELPRMYKLGYNNNNCIGCVKGGAGYWNKIRSDFPQTFNKMVATEREIGATCLRDSDGKRLFLDELSPTAGNATDMVLPECGIFCQVEFAHIMHPHTAKVLNFDADIYDYKAV